MASATRAFPILDHAKARSRAQIRWIPRAGWRRALDESMPLLHAACAARVRRISGKCTLWPTTWEPPAPAPPAGSDPLLPQPCCARVRGTDARHWMAKHTAEVKPADLQPIVQRALFWNSNLKTRGSSSCLTTDHVEGALKRARTEVLVGEAGNMRAIWSFHDRGDVETVRSQPPGRQRCGHQSDDQRAALLAYGQPARRWWVVCWFEAE